MSGGMDGQAARRALQTTFAHSLRRPFIKAVREYGLVEQGDKIAACISGGKDSLLLSLLLQDLQKTMDFELVFLAMDPGYSPASRTRLERVAEQLGLPLEIFRTDVLRVVGNHAAEHPCFLCAKMRRGHLYAQAQQRGCNKIALGHHYDDAVETVLMGLLYGGQIQAMLPRVRAKHYAGMELIRPLYLTRERAVQQWADTCGLTVLPCDCPAKALAQDTKRAEIKALIAALAEKNPQIEANILNAVKNVDTAKLLGWRDERGAHSFLAQWQKNFPTEP